MNAFVKAWKQTIGHKAWLYVGSVGLGIIGSVGATFVTEGLDETKINKALINVAFILLGIFSAFVLIYIIHLILAGVDWIHSRWIEAKCIQALRKANEFHAVINSTNIASMGETDFDKLLIAGCEYLKETFNDLTKSDCGVSIKVSVAETAGNWNTWAFKNRCRASGRDGRDTQQYANKEHLVRKNTAYIEVLNQLQERQPLGYINNNVKKSTDYHTTSSGCYDKKYDYESECVYPIVPITDSEHIPNETYGFICIDSYKTDVFSRSLGSFEILVSYADLFYTIFSKRHK
jgi:hypothetical protein